MSVRGILRVLAGVLVASSGTILGSIFGLGFKRFHFAVYPGGSGSHVYAFFAYNLPMKRELLERFASVEYTMSKSFSLMSHFTSSLDSFVEVRSTMSVVVSVNFC